MMNQGALSLREWMMVNGDDEGGVVGFVDDDDDDDKCNCVTGFSGVSLGRIVTTILTSPTICV
jgi:hypothetical protein